MRTKPKKLGTWLESYTVSVARAMGLKAERLAEGGMNDLGDVKVEAPGDLWVFECKNRENCNEQKELEKALKKAAPLTTRVAVVRRRMARKPGNQRRTQVGPITATVELDLLLRLIKEASERCSCEQSVQS